MPSSLPPLLPLQGPNALDACCASKDPSTDRKACWAWLPSGDCSTVADQYRPACCQVPMGGMLSCMLQACLQIVAMGVR